MVSILHPRFPLGWTALGGAMGGVRVRVDALPGDVVRIRASSRMTRQAGMTACLYVVGDVLVDTGFAHARRAILGALSGRDLRAIACTHHHEDHVANAGPLASAHGCPVYLRHPGRRWSEGVGDLLPYRRLYWGPVADYDPLPLPDRLGEARPLDVVPTPGHSETHVVFHEPRAGVVLTGDLLVSSGAAALMTHESPSQIVQSLRRVAALRPRLLLSGHGLVIEAPAERLLQKADRMEQAAREVRRLHGEGVPMAEIPRRVFRGGWALERWGVFMTQGEFSRRNFVSAALREAGEGAG